MPSIVKELSNHTFSDIMSMGLSFISTKLFYPKARLVRRPFHVRQKANLQYGEGFTTGYNCRFEMFGEGTITLGKECHIGDNVHIAALHSVTLGDNCLLASKIFISDLSHGFYGEHGDNPAIPPNDRPLRGAPVSIGNNVWIGENVCILEGVAIGNGCIIGANATVTHSIPDNCIAVGSPAKPIKVYNNETQSWISCTKN